MGKPANMDEPENPLDAIKRDLTVVKRDVYWLKTLVLTVVFPTQIAIFAILLNLLLR